MNGNIFIDLSHNGRDMAIVALADVEHHRIATRIALRVIDDFEIEWQLSLIQEQASLFHKAKGTVSRKIEIEPDYILRIIITEGGVAMRHVESWRNAEEFFGKAQAQRHRRRERIACWDDEQVFWPRR